MNWFADPANYDFALTGDGSSFIDQGEQILAVTDDFCGNGICESDEDELTCSDDCTGGYCSPQGTACSLSTECCSLKCKGPSGRKTCK